MNLANVYKHLSCYIIACGVTYGNGEDLLYEWFEQAGLQNPADLQVMNEGLNHIPTVHVIDVARLVRKVITIRPAKQYIIAVDKTMLGIKENGKADRDKIDKNSSRAYNIIKSISKNVGSGKVTMVPAETLLLQNPK
jgi:adenylate kinase